MKINNKGELKALIKECLIEILSEGTPVQRSRHVERAERPAPRREPQLPPSIPASMKSIFQDTQQRAASDLYKEASAFEKQTEVLGEMAETWQGMAFAGELPDRAFHPGQHKAAPAPQNHPQHQHRSAVDYQHYAAPQNHMGYDDDFSADDGFDPLAAVLAARKARD